jgi:hypothetical protein
MYTYTLYIIYIYTQLFFQFAAEHCQSATQFLQKFSGIRHAHTLVSTSLAVIATNSILVAHARLQARYVCMLVCTYVCMCVCVCIYIYIYIYVYMYMYIYVCVYMCKHICLLFELTSGDVTVFSRPTIACSKEMHVLTYINTYIYIYIYIHTHNPSHIHTNIYTHMHIYSHAYTSIPGYVAQPGRSSISFQDRVMRVLKEIRVYTYINAHKHTHTHMHIYSHAYTSIPGYVAQPGRSSISFQYRVMRVLKDESAMAGVVPMLVTTAMYAGGDMFGKSLLLQ